MANEAGPQPHDHRARQDELDPFIRDFVAEGLAGPDDAALPLPGKLFVPQIRWDRLAVAAFGRDGRMLAASAPFPFIEPDDIRLTETAGSNGCGVSLLSGVMPDGGKRLVVVAHIQATQGWKLPPEASVILEAEGAVRIGLSAGLVRSREAVLEACTSLGLTSLQGRLIAALVRHGDLDAAATEAGVAYSTAREAVASAMGRIGVRRRSALIERVVQLAFGVFPEGNRGRDILRDAWGLTPRQAGLAASIAQGASRTEAAHSIGVSGAVAKKEMASVFVTLGIGSATELSALLAEAAALAALVDVTNGALAVATDRSEPLQFVARADGGLIAFSDYGPRDGAPVLVLHSSMGSRPAPSRLVAALQDEGFRPFSIDRPGFGLTDWIDRDGDPFEIACDDIRTVCAHLRFERIDLIARGGAQAAMHLAAQSPELLGRVVLVAPDPSSRSSRPTTGILGTAKIAFQSNPALIEPLARMFVANLTTANLRDLVMKPVRTSAPDVAVMNDRKNFSDYCRGFQMFMSGRIRGYVREQSALVTCPDPPANPGASHWRVLIGAHDPLHDPAEIETYWRGLLPAARFETLADGGRFIAMSHAKLVAATLKEAPSSPG